MFYEVDEALRSLVRAELNGADVEVVFEAPTREWSSRRNAPTVNLYLYDIREDLRRRERGLRNEYGEGGRIVARHQAPRHFKVTYLITAWTQRPEDEHRLLSSLLYCFLRNETLPAELLRGPLAEIGLPVSMSVALPPPEDRSFADVWSALGGELKPSLDLVVTAPVDAGRIYPAAPWVESPLGLDFGARDGGPPRDAMRRKHQPPPATEPGPRTAAGSASTQGGVIRVRRKRGGG